MGDDRVFQALSEYVITFFQNIDKILKNYMR